MPFRSRETHQLAGCSRGISGCPARRLFFGRDFASSSSLDLSSPPGRPSRNPPLTRFSSESLSTAVLPYRSVTET